MDEVSHQPRLREIFQQLCGSQNHEAVICLELQNGCSGSQLSLKKRCVLSAPRHHILLYLATTHHVSGCDLFCVCMVRARRVE